MSFKTSLCNERVDQLHLTEPVTVATGTSLRQVIQTMQEKRRGAVLVCSGNTLKGIFSERDLVDRVLGEPVNLDDPIDNFLADNSFAVGPERHVGEVVELMAANSLRHVPVCDAQNQILGIISVRNIIDCLAEQYPAEVINRPPRADQNMAAPEGG